MGTHDRRASLVPAASVTPAPIVYPKVSVLQLFKFSYKLIKKCFAMLVIPFSPVHRRIISLFF